MPPRAYMRAHHACLDALVCLGACAVPAVLLFLYCCSCTAVPVAVLFILGLQEQPQEYNICSAVLLLLWSADLLALFRLDGCRIVHIPDLDP